jgi:uncharacterized membrane protein YczE
MSRTRRARGVPAGVPRLRGSVGVRAVFLTTGLFVFACGIVLTLQAGAGATPWDVLHLGVALHTPLAVGSANIVIALAALAVTSRAGGRSGPGTLANAILLGAFVDMLLLAGPVQRLADAPPPLRAGMLGVGIAAVAAGTALYVGAAFGEGPRDQLMLVIARRGGCAVGLARGIVESAAVAVGVALGGQAGVGTLVFAVAIGPAVQFAFRALSRSRLAIDASLPSMQRNGKPHLSGTSCHVQTDTVAVHLRHDL